MLKRWFNQLYVALVKYRMRMLYRHIVWIYREYNCDTETLYLIHPDIKDLEWKFDRLNETLKDIDPTHPANRG